MACPFLLPRTLRPPLAPRAAALAAALRSKWLAVILLACYLWAYEAFALWDRPAWTAAIIVGYFALAFVIDGLFRGASFCKYLCPIGQFNFVQSQVSPLEVTVRDPDVCARAGPGTASAAATTSPAASWACSSRARWATSIAHSASTASILAHTKTSGSCPSSRALTL